MQTTQQADKMQIAVFGRKNAGKSSLIDALTRPSAIGANGAPGTAAEPALQAFEFKKLSPIHFIDTAGIDDLTHLAGFQESRAVMDTVDLAILIFSEASNDFKLEKEWYRELEKRNVPVIGVINKVDDHYLDIGPLKMELEIPFVKISAKRNINLGNLRHTIRLLAPPRFVRDSIVSELVRSGDLVVMVMPGTISAPQNRLCASQQHILRNLLDHHAVALSVDEAELPAVLASLKNSPDLVITDAKALERVQNVVPEHVPLTTFAVLEGAM